MKASLRDLVYESIMDDIISNELKSFQIISERAIIEKYNCSKSPVREAMLSLCNDGILRSIPRCGYEVLPITDDDAVQLINCRYLLEGGFLKTIINQITDEEIDYLGNLTAPLYTHREDIWKFWDLNTQFHLELIKISQNDYAYFDLKRICSKLKIAYAMINRGSQKAENYPLVPKNHMEIVNSLRRRDLPSALAALHTDLSDFGCKFFTIQEYFT